MLVIVAMVLAFALLYVVDQRLLSKMFSVRIHLPKLSLWLWLIAIVSVLVGSSALAGSVALCLSPQVFWPMWLILLLLLLLTIPRAMEVSLQSLKRTEAHRRYLLGSGATHLESVIPCVRRSLRAAALPLLWQRRSPMIVAMPLMCLTLWMCGATIATALLSTLLTWAVAVVGALLTCVLALWLADYKLFDKRGNLIVASDKP